MKKVIVTVCLALLLAGSVYLMVDSMDEIDSKLRLETASQKTMETQKETEPLTEAATEAEEEIQDTLDTDVQDIETETETEEKMEEETSSSPYAPTLKLRNSQVVVNAGDTLDLIAQVEDVTDDSDNYYELYRNISVSGDYDLDTPGEYTLTYIVTDSNGNVSAPRYLKLIVK
ncbi:MAG: DUF5011 domain-containing protein [Lachnospiraceae bacterium]|nr:DUF5011 domain-containing protein [Lachnospiraceae bacterium]